MCIQKKKIVTMSIAQGKWQLGSIWNLRFIFNFFPGLILWSSSRDEINISGLVRFERIILTVFYINFGTGTEIGFARWRKVETCLQAHFDLLGSILGGDFTLLYPSLTLQIESDKTLIFKLLSWWTCNLLKFVFIVRQNHLLASIRRESITNSVLNITS